MTIGIDLGTTVSAMAVMNEQTRLPEIIPNAEGSRLTPSVVMVTEDGNARVGDVAKENAVRKGPDVISTAKDHMGTQKVFRTSAREFSPEEVSSIILKKLCGDAGKRLGETVTKAVVTIPAYFTDAQRKATYDSGKMAGVEIIRMINEPTAAALYYAYVNKIDSMTLLIYDLGGGTFDATVAKISGGDVNVLATSGIRKMGGHFFDQLIVNHVCDVMLDDHDIDLYDDEYLDVLQKLVITVEQCKIDLSTGDSCTIPVQAGDVQETITISRKDFEQMMDKFYSRTESSVRIALQDAGLTVDDVDKVLLIGGSTRIPMIKERLKALIGKEPSQECNPDEAVALGAAVCAYLEEHKQEVPQTISDVCSHSIGIVTVDGKTRQRVNSIVIPRNSSIPTSASRTFFTAIASQKNIRIEVTEGEDTDLEYVAVIATFDITLPDGIKRDSPIKMEMNLSPDQILTITASKDGEHAFTQECRLNRTQNLEEEAIELKSALISKMDVA